MEKVQQNELLFTVVSNRKCIIILKSKSQAVSSITVPENHLELQVSDARTKKCKKEANQAPQVCAMEQDGE